MTFTQSGADGITKKDEGLFHSVSFSVVFGVVSWEGFALAFFRNSTVVWDDYRQLPFPRDATVFSSLTGCPVPGSGPTW